MPTRRPVLPPTAFAQATRTELAGNPLAQYPFFEYVRAFNVNAPLNVAIDPTRFPAIVGDTCDVYVVNHKTNWPASPGLTVTQSDDPLAWYSGATAGTSARRPRTDRTADAGGRRRSAVRHVAGACPPTLRIRPWARNPDQMVPLYHHGRGA